MSDLAKDLIKDSYNQMQSSSRRYRFVVTLLFLVYVIVYVPLVHLTYNSKTLEDELFVLSKDKVELEQLGKEFHSAKEMIRNASGDILTAFVKRLRMDFKCLEQLIRSASGITPEQIPALKGQLTENCQLSVRTTTDFQQPLQRNQQIQQQLPTQQQPQQQVQQIPDDPSFPEDLLVMTFGRQSSEEAQLDFIEKFLVEPRLTELNLAWRKIALPETRQALITIAEKLSSAAENKRNWTAEYGQIAAELKQASEALARFDFSEPLRGHERRWWRSVEGKDGFTHYELDRLEQLLGESEALDASIVRLKTLESSRKTELKAIEKSIDEHQQQLKTMAGLLGGSAGAGAYLSLPLASVAPTLPLVLGILFAAFLAEWCEQRKRLTSQLKAYLDSAQEERPLLHTLMPQNQGVSITLIGVLASAWILHATFEAYRLMPDSLTFIGFSTGVGLVVLLGVVAFTAKKSVQVTL